MASKIRSLLRWRQERQAKGETTTGSGARSLVASSMPISGPEGKQAWQARSGDDAWQRQAWYHYDACGEMRFAFNLLANAVSRAVLFAAEADPETGQIGEATDDPRVQAAAAAILGGHEDRPQLQSTIALQWQVSGETFILISPQSGADEPDRWITLSSRGVRQKGGTWSFKDPLTGVWTVIGPKDKLIRVWSPHPDEQTHADAATRPALPILTEIEKTSQAIVALLDSRIGSNGLLFVPQEIEFPVAEGEQMNAASFMNFLMQAMEASLQNPGMAESRVPLTALVPGEMIGQIQHIDLTTALDAALTELRTAAVERLGMTLDMPREVALGQTAESNHWSGWLVDESTYKLHVEPFLLKLGAALTKDWFRPALRVMGVENAERFVLDWDISELVARPDDNEKLKGLWDDGLISDSWYLGQLGIPDDAVPADEEVFLKRLERVVMGAPTLAADGEIARRLFGFEIAPAAAGVSDPTAVTEPALEATEGTNLRALPAPATEPAEPDEGLVAAAELVVFDALSRAGGRLLTRQYRGQFASTPKHELHTVIPVGADLDRLLEGSFQFTANVADVYGLSPVGMDGAIREYAEQRLRDRMPHNRDVLRGYLRTVVRP